MNEGKLVRGSGEGVVRVQKMPSTIPFARRKILAYLHFPG